MTTPLAAPGAGRACTLCGETAVVHWLRRLTDDELAVEQQRIQALRDEQLLLSDPALPPPVFPPMPGPDEFTRPVHACAAHGITLDAAALVHTKACTAPAVADLPGCNCTPETTPQLPPEPAPAPLPAGWGT